MVKLNELSSRLTKKAFNGFKEQMQNLQLMDEQNCMMTELYYK
jgi:hypothetical protein